MFCSQECPCSGNPMLYRNDNSVIIIDVESKEKQPECPPDSKKRCLYFGYKDNSYNAQKCFEKQIASLKGEEKTKV